MYRMLYCLLQHQFLFVVSMVLFPCLHYILWDCHAMDCQPTPHWGPTPTGGPAPPQGGQPLPPLEGYPSTRGPTHPPRRGMPHGGPTPLGGPTLPLRGEGILRRGPTRPRGHTPQGV